MKIVHISHKYLIKGQKKASSPNEWKECLMLKLDLHNTLYGRWAMLDGIENVEDSVAPTCNAVNIVLLHGDGCLTITCKVEEVKTCLWRNLLILQPGACEHVCIVTTWRVPELAVGEHHHLVNDGTRLDEPPQRFLTTGTITYLILNTRAKLIKINGIIEKNRIF